MKMNEVKITNADKIIDQMHAIFTKNQPDKKGSVVDDFISRKHQDTKQKQEEMLFKKEPGYESIRQHMKYAIISSTDIASKYKTYHGKIMSIPQLLQLKLRRQMIHLALLKLYSPKMENINANSLKSNDYLYIIIAKPL